ncbi:MAG: DUF6577 family protein [bacterium]
MNTAFLQTQLQLPYRRGTWQTLLPQFFPGLELFSQPADRPLTSQSDRTIASGLRQIGRAILRDNQNAERVVAIFEVDVAPKVDLVRNRVALRQLVARCIDEVSAHAVLAFFVQPDTRVFRLTYAARESVLSDDLKVETRETATKRYTFIMGPGEARRTAAQRLAILAEKHDGVKWEDVNDAFSVEKLNNEFFTIYKEHYQSFCKYLLGADSTSILFQLKLRGMKDKELDKALKPVRDFVKKLLGRIVFLHFLQKKGWLGCSSTRNDWQDGDPQFLKHLFDSCSDKEHFHSRSLVPLFFDTLNNPNRPGAIFALTGTRIPYLNGGLFERDFDDVDQVDFPAELFSGLLEFFGQYNFTIDENDPDDHEIGIDPEMLGHIFENLLEDNKDKGAYYTPKAIVQYMCRQSLSQYLVGHFPDDSAAPVEIERLIRLKEPIDPKATKNWITVHAHRLEELLDKVKVCDPAIGSGAFPIGILQELYWLKLSLHPGLNRAKAKRDIIQKSIHGVDIDAGAIEIARLRFWLALIVDEEEPSPLPNLDYKIMQGDSLLESFHGIPLDTLMPQVRPLYEQAVKQQEFGVGIVRDRVQLELTEADKQHFGDMLAQYFVCTDPQEKRRLHSEIDGFVLKHLDFNVDHFLKEKEGELARLEADLATKKRHKEYKMSAKESRRLKLLTEDVKVNRSRKAKLHELVSISERPYFLWHLFFQDVFKNGGFDIVIGNPPYGRILSRANESFVAERYPAFGSTRDIFVAFIERASDLSKPDACFTYIIPTAWLGGTGYTQFRQKLSSFAIQEIVVLPFDIFREVYVDTLILRVKACVAPSTHQVQTYVFPKKSKINEFSINQWDRISLQSWRENPESKFVLSGAMVGLTERLRASCSRKMKDLVEMKRGVLFDKSLLTDAKSGSKSYPYFEGDIYRYQVNYSVPHWVEYGEGMREYPKEFRWFDEPRLLLRRLVNRQQRLMATLVSGTFVTNKNLYSLLAKNSAVNLKVTLALLNSKLLSRLYIEQVSQATKDDFPQVTITDILELPVPTVIMPDDERTLVNLVDRMIIAQRDGLKDVSDSLDEEIDQIVYRLYGLLPEESIILNIGIPANPAALDIRTNIFSRILPELATDVPYFPVSVVRSRLEKRQIEITDASLQSYMSEAMAQGIVHDAGRGWYSRIAKPFVLDAKPVKGIISKIGKAFPLMEFSCWSTEQVNPYMHHLLAKFVTFVYADRDLMPALFDAMQGWKGYRVYLDPKTADARNFRLEDNTIVIRPDLAQAPESHHHMAPAERLIVDLAVEAEALPILARGEAQDMACRLVTTGRVAMGTLLRYAQRRRVEPVKIFGEKWSTNVTNQENVTLVD